MQALTTLIMFVAVLVAIGALIAGALFVARARYIKSGQEEGE